MLGQDANPCGMCCATARHSRGATSPRSSVRRIVFTSILISRLSTSTYSPSHNQASELTQTRTTLQAPATPPQAPRRPTTRIHNEQLLLPRQHRQRRHATKRALPRALPSLAAQRRRTPAKRHTHGQRPAVGRPADRYELPVERGAAAEPDAGGE